MNEAIRFITMINVVDFFLHFGRIHPKISLLQKGWYQSAGLRTALAVRLAASSTRAFLPFGLRSMQNRQS
jgi:hypothetical protein